MASKSNSKTRKGLIPVKIVDANNRETTTYMRADYGIAPDIENQPSSELDIPVLLKEKKKEKEKHELNVKAILKSKDLHKILEVSEDDIYNPPLHTDEIQNKFAQSYLNTVSRERAIKRAKDDLRDEIIEKAKNSKDYNDGEGLVFFNQENDVEFEVVEAEVEDDKFADFASLQEKVDSCDVSINWQRAQELFPVEVRDSKFSDGTFHAECDDEDIAIVEEAAYAEYKKRKKPRSLSGMASAWLALHKEHESLTSSRKRSDEFWTWQLNTQDDSSFASQVKDSFYDDEKEYEIIEGGCKKKNEAEMQRYIDTVCEGSPLVYDGHGTRVRVVPNYESDKSDFIQRIAEACRDKKYVYESKKDQSIMSARKYETRYERAMMEVLNFSLNPEKMEKNAPDAFKRSLHTTHELWFDYLD